MKTLRQSEERRWSRMDARDRELSLLLKRVPAISSMPKELRASAEHRLLKDMLAERGVTR